MAYNLTDFASYQAYFEALATSHVDIDGFLFGDAEVAMNDGRVWKGKKLWLEPWQPVTITDQLSDNYLQQKKGSLWVGGSPQSKLFQARLDFFAECEVIVKSIIAKLLKDRTEELLITRLTSYSFGMGEFTFSATNMIGCRLDFIFTDPSGFAYDADKWA